MSSSTAPITLDGRSTAASAAAILIRGLFLLLIFQAGASWLVADPGITESEDETTVTVNDAPGQEIYVFGKSVIVKKQAKGVLAVGGDVTIEGSVDGDVATIGGNIIQKQDGYVGGDVFVVGGTYRTESTTPLREANKQTVILDVFENELHDLGQDLTSLFAPSFSAMFLAQRLLVALLWFVISIAMATIAPGAVGRAVTRLNLSGVKTAALGSAVFVLTLAAMIGGAYMLPNYLGATVAVMGLLLVVLAYVFGRVALQVLAGKLIQKYLLHNNTTSEALTILLGVLFWTLLMSLPYVWLIALFTIFATGVGLILTGRSSLKWQNV